MDELNGLLRDGDGRTSKQGTTATVWILYLGSRYLVVGVDYSTCSTLEDARGGTSGG